MRRRQNNPPRNVQLKGIFLFVSCFIFFGCVCIFLSTYFLLSTYFFLLSMDFFVVVRVSVELGLGLS